MKKTIKKAEAMKKGVQAVNAEARSVQADRKEDLARASFVEAEAARKEAEEAAKAAKAEAAQKEAEAERLTNKAREAEAEAKKAEGTPEAAQKAEAAKQASEAEAKARKEAEEAAQASKDKAIAASEAKRAEAEAQQAKEAAKAKAEAAKQEEARRKQEAKEAAQEAVKEDLHAKRAEKTAKEREERKKAAIDKVVKQFAGKPEKLLAARSIMINEKSGKVSARDFSYSFEDYNEACEEKRQKTAFGTVSAFSVDIIGKPEATKARKIAKLCAERAACISASVQATEAEAKAAKAEIDSLLALVGVSQAKHKAKRRDYRAVLQSAYKVDKAGGDEARASVILEAVEAIAARKLRGEDSKADTEKSFEAEEAEAKAAKAGRKA